MKSVTAVAVVAAAAVALVVGSMSDERRSKQVAVGSLLTEPGSRVVSEPSATTPCPLVTTSPPPLTGRGPPGPDYVLDLNTGTRTPLPKAIMRSVGNTPLVSGRYAASSDGSRLAFVGSGEEGSLQIFVAGIDGAGVRQVTHDPTGAQAPAWSPEGSRIAYEGYGDGSVANFFVVDVITGDSRQITHETCNHPGGKTQFTPDGSALLYTDQASASVLRTVPLAGGQSTLLFRLPEGMEGAGNGSLSPDGSLVTFIGGGTFSFGHCGPCRWVASADGTNMRVVDRCWDATPAGIWSPDGSRLVCSDDDGNGINVLDVATGRTSHVAKGSDAIWLDRHRLLVEA
jgi:Tol biopolymer transport system component